MIALLLTIAVAIGAGIVFYIQTLNEDRVRWRGQKLPGPFESFYRKDK